MRPPDFFCFQPPLPSPIFHPFPARLLLSPPHTGTPLRFPAFVPAAAPRSAPPIRPLFPPAADPGPGTFRSALPPAEKFPQRTAAPSSAGTKKPLCGRFGPPTRSPLEWNSI